MLLFVLNAYISIVLQKSHTNFKKDGKKNEQNKSFASVFSYFLACQ
jgi:hypothetical protein